MQQVACPHTGRGVKRSINSINSIGITITSIITSIIISIITSIITSIIISIIISIITSITIIINDSTHLCDRGCRGPYTSRWTGPTPRRRTAAARRRPRPE